MGGTGGIVTADNVQESECLIINGVTLSGSRFRPSDWAQRLAGTAGYRHCDGRFRFNPLVQVVFAGGASALVVDKKLARIEPHLYAFFRKFGSDNDLWMSE